MNKNILLVFMTLFLCVLFSLSLGCRQGASSLGGNTVAPDFSLQDTQGKTFKLSSQRGNPVIIFFGTTWCPACRGEMPHYKDLYNKYASSGMKFLYIDINESPVRVARFAKDNLFPYQVLADTDGSVANNYSIIGVPTIILVNKEGIIIGASHRASDLQMQKLSPVFKN
jgi:peroxiredoxin